MTRLVDPYFREPLALHLERARLAASNSLDSYTPDRAEIAPFEFLGQMISLEKLRSQMEESLTSIRGYHNWLADFCEQMKKAQESYWLSCFSLGVEIARVASLAENLRHRTRNIPRTEFVSFRLGASQGEEAHQVVRTLEGAWRLQEATEDYAQYRRIEILTNGSSVGSWKLLFSSRDLLSSVRIVYWLEKPQSINTIQIPISLPSHRRIKQISLFNGTGQCIGTREDVWSLLPGVEWLFAPVEVGRIEVEFADSAGLEEENPDMLRSMLETFDVYKRLKVNDLSLPETQEQDERWLHWFVCPLFASLRTYHSQGFLRKPLLRESDVRAAQGRLDHSGWCFLYLEEDGAKEGWYRKYPVPNKNTWTGVLQEVLPLNAVINPFNGLHQSSLFFFAERVDWIRYLFTNHNHTLFLTGFDPHNNTVEYSNPFLETAIVQYKPATSFMPRRGEDYCVDGMGNLHIYRPPRSQWTARIEMHRLKNNPFETPLIHHGEIGILIEEH